MLKYPHAYRTARVVLLTKCDLLAQAQLNVDETLALLRRTNPTAEIICTDTRHRLGIGRLAGWLLGVPAAEGFSFGHQDRNLALPLGARAALVVPGPGQVGPPRLLFTGWSERGREGAA